MRDVAGTDVRVVEVSDHLEEADFTILADAHMFKILIASLYSDKPRAVIRELWTNARDSHADAGCLERPFYCQLPTKMEPSFLVRDYGVSLTHQQVMHLYTTVGLSTKKDDNTTVGKFGLGSKVPFSYTDNFTVSAVKDGVKRIYNAYMSAENKPKISLFGTLETDEETGVEVSFPVKAEDISAFHLAAKRVALGFPLVPENNLGIETAEHTILFSGPGWQVMQPDHNTGMVGAFVRQGCVLYPLDAKPFGDSSAAQALVGETMILEMPIGTVDITPSRESLSYDATTVKNIAVKMKEVFATFVETANAKIMESKTLYEAVANRNAVLKAISSPKIREAVSNVLTWRGRPIGSALTVKLPRMESLSKKGLKLSSVVYSKARRAGQYTFGIDTYVRALTLVPNDRIRILTYQGDTPKHFGLRIKAYSDSLRASVGHSFDLYAAPNLDLDSYSAKQLFCAFGRPPRWKEMLVDATTLPFVKPDYSKTMAQLRVFSGTTFCIQDHSPCEDDENVFYIPTKSNEPMSLGKVFDRDSLYLLWTAFKKARVIPESAQLVGIPATRKDLADSIPEGWTDLLEFVRTYIEDSFDAAAATKASQAKHLPRSYQSWPALRSVLGAGYVLPAGSRFTGYLEEIGEWSQTNARNNLHLQIVSSSDYLLYEEEREAMLSMVTLTGHTASFEMLVRKIKAYYPLVCSILEEMTPGMTVARDLMEYVRHVDRFRRTDIHVDFGKYI